MLPRGVTGDDNLRQASHLLGVDEMPEGGGGYVFGSMTVDDTSLTPYSDATQVRRRTVFIHMFYSLYFHCLRMDIICLHCIMTHIIIPYYDLAYTSYFKLL